jgi:dimethylargininase
MFTKAIVRPPSARFAAGLTTVDLGTPNYARALKQHAAYCAALEQCGLTLTRLEADERYPDSTFVEDTAVMVAAITKQKPARKQGLESFESPEVNLALPDGRASAWAVLTRPGAASRAGEVESISEVLSRFCGELPSIKEPGTLDGGDVCEAEDHFFIGISERTNEAGAQQLATLLAHYGYTSSYINIREVKDILHLKSGLAYLGDNRLVVIEALAEREDFGGYERVRVKASEQYAANCVQVNDYVLVAAGYPGFEQPLQDLGYKTLSVEMTEFQKMDGGLSCLSLRF